MPPTPTLQEDYWRWHTQGLDLAFRFQKECHELITSILSIFAEDTDPEVRCQTHILFIDHATFESAWIDDHDRACCAAMIEDGAPMGWRVEFLDLYLKRELHEILLKTRNELRQ